MKMETKIYKLSEIALNICDGVHNTVIDDPNGLKFLLSAKNIKNGKVNYDIKDRRINESTRSRLNKRTKLEKDDVVITTIGTIGEGAVIREDSDYYEFQRSVGIIKPNKKIVLPYYLYYVLTSNYINEYFHILATGAAQPCIFLKTLKNLKIEVPTICNQVKIIDVVQKFDLLIENNNKRIKILEEMAENLYKEWFVLFRFPGYENTEFENVIPNDWIQTKLGSYYDISIGKTPSRAEPQWFTINNNAVDWVSISDFKNGIFLKDTNEQLTYDAINKFNIRVVPKHTILLSFKLTVGKVAITTKEQTTTNEAIAHVLSNDLEFEYVYFYLKNFEYSKLGNTSSIGNAVNSKIIKNMNFILPNKDLLKDFHNKTKNLFKLIEKLVKINEYLEKQRDALLPKLMSGKLEI